MSNIPKMGQLPTPVVDPWYLGKKLSLVHWNGTGVPKDTIKENATATTAGDRPKGRVVGILKRNWREYCGSLRPLQAERQRESGPGVYNKSDRVFIPTESWHFDGWKMVKSVEACGNTYAILSITIHWHKPSPNFCRFIVGLTRFSICSGSWGIANFDPDPDVGMGVSVGECDDANGLQAAGCSPMMLMISKEKNHRWGATIAQHAMQHRISYV
jgi:hypothetical protein